MRRHVLGYQSSRRDHAELFQSYSCQNHGARTDCGPFFDHCAREPASFAVSVGGIRKPRGSRPQIVGKHDLRTDEGAVANRDSGPNAVSILNRDVVANCGSSFNETLTADIAVLAHCCAARQMREGPDAGARTYLIGVDNCGWMYIDVFHCILHR